MKLTELLLIAGGFCSPLAQATNGMNMDGYGPVAESMGGASMAYDNGTAAVINNPATLGFMAPGTSRLDIALGNLMPDVSSLGASSYAKNFYMPAAGYISKNDNIAYGIGLMAQGGVGTEYSNSSAFGLPNGVNFAVPGTYPVTDPGLKNKSEVGVGRLIFPLAYNVSPDLNIGGSIDYVWAGIDIQWLMDGTHFSDMLPTAMNPGAARALGSIANTSSMLSVFGTGMGKGVFTSVDYGYFNFSTSSTFTQKATVHGYAGNIGFTFKVNPRLTVGGVYHGKTSLSDLKTGSSDATLSFGVRGGSLGTATIPVSGQVIIKNFQWPETLGLGLSYQATDQWQIVTDYKRIGWAGVMKNFNMSFIASSAASNGSFANTQLDLTYNQNWKDQDILMLGAAYKYSDTMTLRFGGNFSNNPIPNQYVSPLFPTIVKTHYTSGLGYMFSKNNSMDVSFAYAPKVTVTNNWSAAGGTNQTISVGGTSWQAMWSHSF